MDNFSEQLVKKQYTGSDRIKTILTIVIGGLIALFFVVTSLLSLGSGLFAFVGMILAVGAALVTFKMYRDTQIEYEYAYTNGELDIDKIIAQRKRSEMISVEVRKFTDFGRYNAETPEESAETTVIMASDNIASHEYYADFPHEDYGSVRLVFSPDERMLENIIKGLAGPLRKKLNSQNTQEDRSGSD